MGTLLGGRTRCKILFQWAKSSRFFSMSQSRLDRAMEKLEKNPYFEKYAERIAKLQRTSPEEFLKRAEKVAPPPRPAVAAPQAPDTRQYASVLNPKEALKSNLTVEDKKLDDIFKTDLVKDKSALEIQQIWEEYHKEKEVISAIIPLNIYSELMSNMKENPTFIFPLPRSQGYEFIMCQSCGNSVHFTPLLAYQVHKENAPECLTMVHFMELKDKGIVLMRGEYDKNVLNAQEAQCLANQFQMYYNGKDKAKSELLNTFSSKPDSFKHMDLIAQLENITLT